MLVFVREVREGVNPKREAFAFDGLMFLAFYDSVSAIIHVVGDISCFSSLSSLSLCLQLGTDKKKEKNGWEGRRKEIERREVGVFGVLLLFW